MKRRPTLRVELAPSSDTSILCLVCGRFRCELAVVSAAGEPGMGAFAGVHRKCLRIHREHQKTGRAADKAARAIHKHFDALEAAGSFGGKPDPDES